MHPTLLTQTDSVAMRIDLAALTVRSLYRDKFLPPDRANRRRSDPGLLWLPTNDWSVVAANSSHRGQILVVLPARWPAIVAVASVEEGQRGFPVDELTV